ncbi:hypothetical protein LOK49_LG07G00402 [Camellia lanceoleosa]|uniref:Uncharacterized protein n=1 Tax=Camellia lanceoleosa TaxID=1840588 RepID=A0ACC0GZG1_9ERIC|nr:hypothetical protein LOK49_LG07G00402 [Camellia lanceoleosa]
MAQKLVLKVMTMTDEKTKKKAIEAAADIFGIIDVDLMGMGIEFLNNRSRFNSSGSEGAENNGDRRHGYCGSGEEDEESWEG